MSELKPCPFCGGEAVPFNPFDNTDGTWCVLCSECASATGFEQTEAQAIAAWNSRVEHGTLTAEQVSKATYAHSIHADCADADWQAIADELNSRAERTCSIAEYGESDNPDAFVKPCKFTCGHWGTTFDRFCRHCGCKVVD